MKRFMSVVAVACAAGLIFSACGEKQAETTSVKEEQEVTTEKPGEKTEEKSEEKPEEETDATTTYSVGTTGFTITVPDDYRLRDVDDREEDQISYINSVMHDMDFDVYQFLKEEKTLEEAAKEDAKEYGVEDVEMIKVNGFDVALYYSEEEYEGKTYPVSNYLFDTGDYFAEICFWLDGDDAEELSESIMNTLADGGIEITSTGIKTDDPIGIDLGLDNPSDQQITMDIAAYSLRYDDEILRPVAAAVTEDPRQKDSTYTFYVGADSVDPGTEISLYYGEIFITSATTAGSSKEEATDQKTEEATEQKTEEAAAPVEGTGFAGSWMFYATLSDNPEESVAHEDLDTMKAQGFDYAGGQVIDLNDNGTYLFYLFDEVLSDSWTDNGDGTGTIILLGDTCNIAIEDGLLVFYMPTNVTRFERSERSAAELAG